MIVKCHIGGNKVIKMAHPEYVTTRLHTTRCKYSSLIFSKKNFKILCFLYFRSFKKLSKFYVFFAIFSHLRLLTDVLILFKFIFFYF